MSREAETIYSLMLEEFKRTGERTITIEAPFSLRNKRKEICLELEINGLISNCNIYGQQSISCVLSDDDLCLVKIE